MQKKVTNYGQKKLTPAIQNVGSQALDQLSAKIRPNKKHKTDRKDLDRGSLQKGGNIQEFINQIAKIANDPQKLNWLNMLGNRLEFLDIAEH